MFYELENKKNRIIGNSQQLFTQRRYGEMKATFDGDKQGKIITDMKPQSKLWKQIRKLAAGVLHPPLCGIVRLTNLNTPIVTFRLFVFEI